MLKAIVALGVESNEVFWGGFCAVGIIRHHKDECLNEEHKKGQSK
ncbi:hypothetical protein [Amphritea sp.]